MVDIPRGLTTHQFVKHVAAHRLWIALDRLAPPASAGRLDKELHGATTHRTVGWCGDGRSVGGAAADRANGASPSSEHAGA